MSNSPFIRDVPAAQALGAGTRVLLDHLLSQCGVAPDSITGNSREEAAHLAVAAAAAAGRARRGACGGRQVARPSSRGDPQRSTGPMD